MTYELRQLGRNDAGTLKAMLTMFGHAFGDVPAYSNNQPSDAYLQRLLVRDTFIALAAIAKDGTVVGGLAAYVLEKFEQERSEIYIYDLAVALPYRRHGLATALIEALRTIARERGAYVIFCAGRYAGCGRYRALHETGHSRRRATFRHRRACECERVSAT